ncbi:MAG: aspartate aminotransferase family protein [Anaerovorax sp.]|nr:aspartate aminotransferase family protein [Anaerovorax sp.]
MKNDYFIPFYSKYDLTFNKGLGSWLYDDDGNAYLDFISGIAVNTLGHCHPALVETIQKQSNTLMNISNYFWNDTVSNLAKRLSELTGLSKVFFCNSGTEANEAVIKIARKYGSSISPSKKKIIYMKNSFHGRTLGSLSITGQEKYQKKFRPLLEDVEEAIFNDLKSVEALMNDSVSAVILEPIQGECGVISATEEFIIGIRKLCDHYNALLIFDEVQSGMGRSGHLFAYQYFNAKPDLISIAKGLGGGFPIGAVAASDKAANCIEPGDHGSTFGGNPLACACGLTILEQLVDNHILAGVNKKSNQLVAKLKELQKSYPLIQEIRGKGLLLGVHMKHSSKEIIKKCMDQKLLLAGSSNETIRILPPLTVSEEEINLSMNRFETVLKQFK